MKTMTDTPNQPGQSSDAVDVEFTAMNIVHQLGDALYEALPKDVAHDHFVDARQTTNDVAIDFTKKLISQSIRTELESLLGELPKKMSRNIDEDYAYCLTCEQIVDGESKCLCSQQNETIDQVTAKIKAHMERYHG